MDNLIRAVIGFLRTVSSCTRGTVPKWRPVMSALLRPFAGVLMSIQLIQNLRLEPSFPNPRGQIPCAWVGVDNLAPARARAGQVLTP